MRKVRPAARVLIVCVLFALGILLLPRDKPECGEQYEKDIIVRVEGMGVSFVTQQSSTPIERELGLSGKTCIPKGTAMLFEFDDPGYYGIWMKGMKFPIDAVWLDSGGFVVDIESSMKPESYPNIYTPDKEALYVVELREGTVKDTGLRVGTKLTW